MQVRDARISYDGMVASHVNLEIGRVAPGATIPVKAALELVTKPGEAPMNVAAGFDLAIAGDAWRFAKVGLDGTYIPQPGAASMKWQLASPQMTLDLDAQTLAATSFQAEVASARLTGHLSGAKLIDAPELTGDFDLQPISVRELLKQLAVAVPATRDTHVLTKLAARGRFAYGGNAARTEGLIVQLNDSRLEGSFAVTDLDTMALAFDLAIDHIDLDRYLPPPTQAQAMRRTSRSRCNGSAQAVARERNAAHPRSQDHGRDAQQPARRHRRKGWRDAPGAARGAALWWQVRRRRDGRQQRERSRAPDRADHGRASTSPSCSAISRM